MNLPAMPTDFFGGPFMPAPFPEQLRAMVENPVGGLAIPSTTPGYVWLVFPFRGISDSNDGLPAMVRGMILGGLNAAVWGDLWVRPNEQETLLALGGWGSWESIPYKIRDMRAAAVEVPTAVAVPVFNYVVAERLYFCGTVEGGQGFAKRLVQVARQHLSRRPW